MLVRAPRSDSTPSLLERVRAHLAGEGRPPSRARVEAWIRGGAARLDGVVARDPHAVPPPQARLSVDVDDLADGPGAARGARGARTGAAPRAPLPAGVLHADPQVVVVERAAFAGAATPDALAGAVGRALSLPGRAPVVLVPTPDPAGPGSGPVLLAASRAAASRLAAMVRDGRVLETLLSLRAPAPLGPGESILEQGAGSRDGSAGRGAGTGWELVEREGPLAPPTPGTRALAPPHRAALTLKHPKTQRVLEFSVPPPSRWPAAAVGAPPG